jgi:hypothetical protein
VKLNAGEVMHCGSEKFQSQAPGWMDGWMGGWYLVKHKNNLLFEDKEDRL